MDDKNEELVVGYFKYDDISICNKATSEQERITKLEKQINYDNPRLVYALYCKIVEGDYFATPEGILYMVHLQDYLYMHEDECPGPILPIPYHPGKYSASDEPVPDMTITPSDKTEAEYEEEKARLLSKIRELETAKSKAYKNLKIKNKKTDSFIYKMIIVAMAIVIIAMIIISAASDSPTILNYRNEIQNEYADWEQKLTEKEKQLNERERELDAREAESSSETDRENNKDSVDM